MAAVADRRRFLASSVAACAAASGWGTASAQTKRDSEKPELTRLTLAVGGKASFFHLPLSIADQLGYFRAEGVDVEVADFPDWLRAQQAVLGGAAEVCSGSFEHVISLQQRRQFYQSIVLQGRAPQVAMGVSTRTLAQYRSAADLRGRRIGVSSLGSTTQLIAQLVLAQAGVSAREVNYVSVGSAAGALAALRSGQVDAMSNSEPVMTMLEQRGDVRIISDTRTLKGTAAVFGGMMPSACLYSGNDFVRAHPRTCQALANGIVHALKWLQTAGPSDMMKTVPESYLLGDRALYLASFANVREAFSTDGLVPADGVQTALRALAVTSTDASARGPVAGLLYTNDFARKAKDRFRV